MRINEGEEFGVERDTDIVDDGVRREGGDGGGSEERVEWDWEGLEDEAEANVDGLFLILMNEYCMNE